MTRTQFASGAAIVIAIAIAGWLSETALDRHFAVLGGGGLAAGDRGRPPVPSAACVGADGSWRNWAWANVPMLAPKCAPEH